MKPFRQSQALTLSIEGLSARSLPLVSTANAWSISTCRCIGTYSSIGQAAGSDPLTRCVSSQANGGKGGRDSEAWFVHPSNRSRDSASYGSGT